MRDVKKLPNYVDAICAPKSSLNDDYFMPSSLDDVNDDDLLRIVVQTNPVTGFPRNDLSIILDDSTPNEVKDYLVRCIRQVAPKTSKVDDDTLLMELQQGKYETASAYVDRLNAIVAEIDSKSSE